MQDKADTRDKEKGYGYVQDHILLLLPIQSLQFYDTHSVLGCFDWMLETEICVNIEYRPQGSVPGFEAN